MTTITEQIAGIHETVDRLKPLLLERNILESLRAQGIDTDQVKELTFKTELLDYHERKAVRAAGRRDEFPPEPYGRMLNAAVMKDGSVKRLHPMVVTS